MAATRLRQLHAPPAPRRPARPITCLLISRTAVAGHAPWRDAAHYRELLRARFSLQSDGAERRKRNSKGGQDIARSQRQWLQARRGWA